MPEENIKNYNCALLLIQKEFGYTLRVLNKMIKSLKSNKEDLKAIKLRETFKSSSIKLRVLSYDVIEESDKSNLTATQMLFSGEIDKVTGNEKSDNPDVDYFYSSLSSLFASPCFYDKENDIFFMNNFQFDYFKRLFDQGECFLYDYCSESNYLCAIFEKLEDGSIVISDESKGFEENFKDFKL